MSTINVCDRVPSWDDPDLAGEYWVITVGAFFDRFDTYGGSGTKLAILSSTDSTVQAMVTDAMARIVDGIDLKRADLPGLMGLLGTKIPAVTSGCQAGVMNSPTVEKERLTKGLPQPQ